MIKIKNTVSHYGMIAVILHWLMALFILLLLALGFYMTSLPDSGFTKEKIILVLLHKELGMWVLFLVMVRLLWRWCNVSILLPDHLPSWQKTAAHTAHWMLYFFMFVMPITGWLMSSAGDYPSFFFGFLLPDLIGINFDDFLWYRELHRWLGYGLLLTITGHTGAALMHHFILKDGVLRSMLFFWK